MIKLTKKNNIFYFDFIWWLLLLITIVLAIWTAIPLTYAWRSFNFQLFIIIPIALLTAYFLVFKIVYLSNMKLTFIQGLFTFLYIDKIPLHNNKSKQLPEIILNTFAFVLYWTYFWIINSAVYTNSSLNIAVSTIILCLITFFTFIRFLNLYGQKISNKFANKLQMWHALEIYKWLSVIFLIAFVLILYIGYNDYSSYKWLFWMPFLLLTVLTFTWSMAMNKFERSNVIKSFFGFIFLKKAKTTNSSINFEFAIISLTFVVCLVLSILLMPYLSRYVEYQANGNFYYDILTLQEVSPFIFKLLWLLFISWFNIFLILIAWRFYNVSTSNVHLQ